MKNRKTFPLITFRLHFSSYHAIQQLTWNLGRVTEILRASFLPYQNLPLSNTRLLITKSSLTGVNNLLLIANVPSLINNNLLLVANTPSLVINNLLLIANNSLFVTNNLLRTNKKAHLLQALAAKPIQYLCNNTPNKRTNCLKRE